jgi:hypothetical protein
MNDKDIGTLTVLCNTDVVRRDGIVKVINRPEVVLKGSLSLYPFVLGGGRGLLTVYIITSPARR